MCVLYRFPNPSLTRLAYLVPARNLGLDVFLDLVLPPNRLLPLSASDAEDGVSVVLRSLLRPAAPPLNRLLPPLFVLAEVAVLGLAVVLAALGSSVTGPALLLGVTVVDIAPSGGGCLMKLGRVGRGRAA